MSELRRQKSSLRAKLLARRHNVGQAVRADASAALVRAIERYFGAVIAGYAPMREEADPMPALRSASRHGPICLPVVMAAAQPLAFREWTPGADMVAGSFGALIPAAGAWQVPQVLIVPLLGFDEAGNRLGYGGGFYDRTLEKLRQAGPVTAIGFGFEVQCVSAVPCEPTDRPLDALVTEARTIYGISS